MKGATDTSQNVRSWTSEDDAQTLEELEQLLQAIPKHQYDPGIMTLRETSDMRHDVGSNLIGQRRGALEDRRSSTREIMRDNPLVGLGMMLGAPAEMLVKYYGDKTKGTPLAGPEQSYMGRSGYFDPMANIGASWTGGGQGINDLYQMLLKLVD